MTAITGKSLLGAEVRQKVPKKMAENVKRNNDVAAEQLTVLPVDKSSDKHYIPDEFTGEHVTELLAENAALKNQVRLT